MPKTDGYISLMEASKHCNYTQEYLSLRARQGKLKAIKFGRNWVTKKEWLEEYLAKNSKSEILISKEIPNSKIQGFRYSLRYGLIAVLIFFFLSFLVSTTLIFNKDARRTTSGSFVVNGEEVLKTFGYIGNSANQDFFLAENQENLKESVTVFQKFGIWYKEQATFLTRTMKELPFIIGEKIIGTSNAFKNGYNYATNFVKEKLSGLLGKPERTEEGLVVIPSTNEDEQIKEKIKESFSDEVRVEIEDESSGVVIPVFKNREGEKYLYIMVPIKN